MRNTTFMFVSVLAFAVPSLPVAQDAMVDGQVTNIDHARGTVELQHGPIKKLNMVSMTMIFRVQDPAMLKGVKVGDKVKFEADQVNGRIMVTRIEKAE